MTKTKTTTPPTIVALPPALHIPVSILAQMPEKLRMLGVTIQACSKVVDGSYEEFREAHKPVRTAYDDANGTANCIVNAIGELSAVVTPEITDAITSARSARALTNAIYKACGNIHNDDCFKTTFGDLATVNATVNALGACGDEIRESLRKFGY